MEKELQLHLKKLFPHFSSPLYSRFSILFNELSKINITQSKNLSKTKLIIEKENQDLEKYRIYPEKLLNGTEKRTSIIIKEIPSAFGALNFYNLLTKFCNQINCFFIPGYAIEKKEYLHAFVTTGHRKGVLDIYEGFTLLRDKFKSFKGYDFSKIEIYFCKSQYRTDLMKKCHNEMYENNFFIVNK